MDRPVEADLGKPLQERIVAVLEKHYPLTKDGAEGLPDNWLSSAADELASLSISSWNVYNVLRETDPEELKLLRGLDTTARKLHDQVKAVRDNIRKKTAIGRASRLSLLLAVTRIIHAPQDDVVEALSDIMDLLNRIEALPSALPKKPRARPQHLRANAIAVGAAAFVVISTGKPPGKTVDGPFVRLVEALFTILEAKVSAKERAMWAIGRLRALGITDGG
ncbi:MAG: hypothetical protein JWR10_852 [Rubritepida sp.]|nr:hypothetical protein [Rubritepida sp.]